MQRNGIFKCVESYEFIFNLIYLKQNGLLQTNNNIIEFCARATFRMDSIEMKQFSCEYIYA